MLSRVVLKALAFLFDYSRAILAVGLAAVLALLAMVFL